jgi:hypothetical protein
LPHLTFGLYIPPSRRSSLDDKIINPAEARFAELLARKAEKMKGEVV